MCNRRSSVTKKEICSPEEESSELVLQWTSDFCSAAYEQMRCLTHYGMEKHCRFSFRRENTVGLEAAQSLQEEWSSRSNSVKGRAKVQSTINWKFTLKWLSIFL